MHQRQPETKFNKTKGKSVARQHLAYYPHGQQTIAKTIIAIQIKFSGCPALLPYAHPLAQINFQAVSSQQGSLKTIIQLKRTFNRRFNPFCQMAGHHAPHQ